MIDEIVETQHEAVTEAARRIAGSIAGEGIAHLFGCSHASMIGREVTGRAGGLVPVNVIPDLTDGLGERVEGYAQALLDRYAQKYGVHPGEVLVVISNSGINALPIEMAMAGRGQGLFVIGLTNLAQTRSAVSRHSSGKRLFEIVDLVIDNRVEPGDAMVDFEAIGLWVGAGSSFAGMLVMQMVMLTAIELLVEGGHTPPVLRSQNLPGADAWNEELRRRYQGRLVITGV